MNVSTYVVYALLSHPHKQKKGARFWRWEKLLRSNLARIRCPRMHHRKIQIHLLYVLAMFLVRFVILIILTLRKAWSWVIYILKTKRNLPRHPP